ncbi:MAG: hypothetical protein HC838_06145 [Spirulinaceae cyanobacterium RM2_2_10]|nr:hypothetical protein [Spirulinaceae cyanobacterium SM2_1_0]NJO19726.1 hypothetical protein [Spirulinaceae cyanobacterium RM2_2_10]
MPLPAPLRHFGLLCVALGLLSSCGSNASPDPVPTPTTTTAPSPSPVTTTTPTSPPVTSNVLQDARDVAAGARTIAQSAKSPQDWQLVTSQWQRAIDKLLALPAAHPDKAQANALVAELRRDLTAAETQARAASSPAVAPPPPSRPEDAPDQGAAPAIATTGQLKPPPAAAAGDAKVALAKHLQQTGARLYSTYWCGACRYQKDLFGEAAVPFITEVECDPRGENPQTALCRQQGVRAYPTWEIGGQLLQPGAVSLQQLAVLSGYSGPSGF